MSFDLKYLTGAAAGGGDVTAAANITDNAIVRGDGGAKGIQGSPLLLDDNGGIELVPAPSSDDTANGFIATVTVDSNATGIGAALYMASDGHYDETDADAAATMPCTALALETGTGSKKVLHYGYIRNDTWNWGTVGGKVYVHTTTGALTQTAPSGSGDQVQVVGFATHADRIFFNPSLDVVEVP